MIFLLYHVGGGYSRGGGFDGYDNSFPYSDIIDLPHHQAEGRKHMSLYDRSAQFSPYAALVGYDELIKL